MNVKTLTVKSPLYPDILRVIPDPPTQLYYLGNIETVMALPRLAIVGSRKVSAYGKSVTLKLAKEATEQGIVIVSGLALGVDGLAHQAALDAGGKTVAVLPSCLDAIISREPPTACQTDFRPGRGTHYRISRRNYRLQDQLCSAQPYCERDK